MCARKCTNDENGRFGDFMPNSMNQLSGQCWQARSCQIQYWQLWQYFKQLLDEVFVISESNNCFIILCFEENNDKRIIAAINIKT